jgi:hypothetical protein
MNPQRARVRLGCGAQPLHYSVPAVALVVLLSGAFLFLLHETLVVVQRDGARWTAAPPPPPRQPPRAPLEAAPTVTSEAVAAATATVAAETAATAADVGDAPVMTATAAAAASEMRALVDARARAASSQRHEAPLRSYARMAGVDATGVDLLFLENATLRRCLRACDSDPRCGYVVRNVTAASAGGGGGGGGAERASQPQATTQCWVKMGAVLNAFPERTRETWVVAKARQPRLALGVLSAPQFVATRLVAAFATWLQHEDALVVLENETSARAAVGAAFGAAAATGEPAVNVRARGSRVMFMFEPADAASEPGAWKNLVLLKKMTGAWRTLQALALPPGGFGRGGSADAAAAGEPDWYLIVDDDSFVIMRTLRYLLAVAAPWEPWFTGLVMAARDYTGGAQFVQGGAGIVLSAPVMERTRAKADCCVELCRQRYGDFRTGCCVVQAARVSGTLHRGFYSYTAWENVGTPMRKLYGFPMFPVSFHRFRDTRMIYLFQRHIDHYLFRRGAGTARGGGGGAAASRAVIFPVDPQRAALRDRELAMPPSRRTWAFFEDAITQRMMMTLPRLDAPVPTATAFLHAPPA